MELGLEYCYICVYNCYNSYKNIFICINALPTFLYVFWVHAVFMKARRGHQIFQNRGPDGYDTPC